jgi:hypothetical protein
MVVKEMPSARIDVESAVIVVVRVLPGPGRSCTPAASAIVSPLTVPLTIASPEVVPAVSVAV